MRVALLCTPATTPSATWVCRELRALSHQVDDASPTVTDAATAASTGHDVADQWTRDRPDVVLALGWEAGLSAHVAARAAGPEIPVLLRLTRAGRDPGSDSDRLELAVARGSRRVLVPSVGEVDRLVDRGMNRSLLRVLPDTVDRSRFVDQGAELPVGAAHRIGLARRAHQPDSDLDSRWEGRGLPGPGRTPTYDVVPVSVDSPDETTLAERLRSFHALVLTDDTDEEVAVALRARSCAVPVVAVASPTLSDIVADGITGVLVRRPSDVPAALHSLLADPLRRQSMGLAAVDRVRARFDTGVVGRALEAVLLEVLPRSVAIAS